MYIQFRILEKTTEFRVLLGINFNKMQRDERIFDCDKKILCRNEIDQPDTSDEHK